MPVLRRRIRNQIVRQQGLARGYGGNDSYGHVYQFSRFTQTISTTEFIAVCSPLTGNMTISRSEMIPTEAKTYIRDEADDDSAPEDIVKSHSTAHRSQYSDGEVYDLRIHWDRLVGHIERHPVEPKKAKSMK